MPGNDPSDVPNLRPDGVWAAIQYCRGDATNPGRRVKLSLRLRPTPLGWCATFVPRNVRVIHPYSDCQSQLGPYSAWGRRRTPLVPGAQRRRGNRRTDHDAYRIRTQSRASMANALASAIESTIDSGFDGCYATLSRRPTALNAPARTTGNALGRTTTDPERTTPNGTAPGRAKPAMPAVRNAKPALAWRYPTRTPAALRIVSPPAPGKARAASRRSPAIRATVGAGRSVRRRWADGPKRSRGASRFTGGAGGWVGSR